jgi:hypothetical protein
MLSGFVTIGGGNSPPNKKTLKFGGIEVQKSKIPLGFKPWFCSCFYRTQNKNNSKNSCLLHFQ